MATLNDADIESIVDLITIEVDDIANLLPVGYTLTQVIATIGPRLLDYVNSRLLNKYEPQNSPLESQTLTLISWGCMGEILLSAYRRELLKEKEWADEWFQRFVDWLEDLATGKVGLSVPSIKVTATPSFSSQPRQFAMENPESYSSESIIDLSTIL